MPWSMLVIRNRTGSRAVNFDQETVEHALLTLREKGLLLTNTASRVPKYGHRISEKLNLGRRELAIICELMPARTADLG